MDDDAAAGGSPGDRLLEDHLGVTEVLGGDTPKTFDVIMHSAGRSTTFFGKGQARLPSTIFSSVCSMT